MTLLDEMADYQQPPHITNPPPMKKLAQLMEMEKMHKRIEIYKTRHQDMLVSSHAATQQQYKDSSEKTALYHERWQQVKAKKSNKRQRDSTGSTATQLKRKLSNKSEGPTNKKLNPDNSTANPAQEEENEAELSDLLFDVEGLDGLDQMPAGNNLKDIMTMLEESESSNASAQECVEKAEPKHPNGLYHQQQQPQHPPPGGAGADLQQTIAQLQHIGQQQHQQQQQQQQQQQHLSNTPSPQLQHNQHNGMPAQQPGVPYMRQQSAGYPPVVKSERIQNVSQYSRSVSESIAAQALRQQHMERQISVPAEYSRQFPAGPYPAGAKPLPHPLPHPMSAGGLPHGSTVPHEYVRQMSAPNGQTGAYYRSQLTANGREYPPGAAVPGYHPYPSGQYGHPNQHMNSEELQRIERMRAAQKAQQVRAAQAPAVPTHYVDPRMVHPGGYYPPILSPEQSPAVAMHQAVLRANPMHPTHQGAGQQMLPQYMHTRPGYPMPSSTAAPAAPMMSRQLPTHHQPSLSEEQQHHVNLAKVSNMQHPAGTLAHSVSSSFPASQPSMSSATASYPPVPNHLRTMSSVNPAMMSQQHANAQLSSHHMARPQSNGTPQVLGQSSMMAANHPSVNSHSHPMHRPTAGEVHQQQQQQTQLMPHTTSPPHHQQPHTPHTHSTHSSHAPTAQMYMQPSHAHQRSISQMQQQQCAMLPQHINNISQQPRNAAMALQPQQNQTSHQQLQQQGPPQHIPDECILNDLELILSESQ